MTRTLEEMGIEEIQILQIVREGTTLHKLAILNQMKQYAVHAGKEFDISRIQKYVDELVSEGLMRFIEKIESYTLTEAGQEVLFS